MVERCLPWVLALGLMVGCSYYHGKGGAIDQAMLKDIAADARFKGKDHCDEEDIQEACLPDKQAQCRAACERILKEEFRR